ncbi:MAG TPA: PD-(D/E)XK nuclease domain-containing protein [Candidatus Deferrimicrobium sp.]|nr:PD-(D/E)XK nuclease domain-containing protein [Candidatus Kapabacteria bacterium]HLP58640.1 PD-(D/E)XK nuclease domain-containing protein [Candidatus Deferrimicrobium sp.]
MTIGLFGFKYSYLIEIKYSKPQDRKKELTPRKLKQIKEEAKAQLNQYSRDEKFQKANGQNTLKKVVLIFSGTQLIYQGEV